MLLISNSSHMGYNFELFIMMQYIIIVKSRDKLAYCGSGHNI